MTTETGMVKRGQFIVITHGEYSDYGIREYVRALKDFNQAEVSAAFKASDRYRMENDWGGDGVWGSDDRFIAWAMEQGYLDPVDASEVLEWHIGSYGRFGYDN